MSYTFYVTAGTSVLIDAVFYFWMAKSSMLIIDAESFSMDLL